MLTGNPFLLREHMRKYRKFLLLLTVAILVLAVPNAHAAFDTQEAAGRIRAFIQGFGPLSVVIYILLYALNTFSPFFPPIFILSLMAGALFGPVMGTVALMLATWAGTTAVFFVARHAGGGWVKKFIQGKSKDWYEKLSDNGFFILLPARLVGFPPYGIIDAVCGLSKMRYADFAAATMIGAVPWVVPQVLLADRFTRFNPRDPVLWGLLVIFVAMIVVTGKVVKKKQAAEARAKGNAEQAV